ncbi:alkaline phosphatase [Musca vetustissima]|uniref:alkaline phosphatase n=1 Tax=Musca vetustissima TaxID=27455 RepID=UPI002AB5E20E|nr:alkaline phosphatase [Musca vetustissima]
MRLAIGVNKNIFYAFPQPANDSAKISDPDVLKNVNFWLSDSQQSLRNKLYLSENKNIAKNVIFFIGDGMSVSTVTASRIYGGQMKGIVGERNSLFMERFPYVGLSKTYCADRQVSDSACTATAYHTGIKANFATIGVSAHVKTAKCEAALKPEHQLESISSWAQKAGKATGIVTTTRITHATPAGAYAHTSLRDYESDFDVIARKADPKQCIDVARQLVENKVSKNFNVIMGGGATKLLPNGTMHDSGFMGERLDGRNIIDEWIQSKDDGTSFVHNRQQLLELDTEVTNNLIGIFANSHMSYNLDNDGSQPTLKEMTAAAISILKKEPNGFFLFVEGGRIDHAHHETKAKKALDETVQFDEAIRQAYELTDPSETLIVISADHGHTMTINGYPKLGNAITGISTEMTNIDFLPYTTLSYANGPAFSRFLYSSHMSNMEKHNEDLFSDTHEDVVKRYDVRKITNIGEKDFQYPAAAPMIEETHGGGDVAIYANGPWSHLFTGVLEQNTLPIFMAFAACIGPDELNSCNYNTDNSGNKLDHNLLLKSVS